MTIDFKGRKEIWICKKLLVRFGVRLSKHFPAMTSVVVQDLLEEEGAGGY